MGRSKIISLLLFLGSLVFFFVSWARGSAFFFQPALVLLVTAIALLTPKFREFFLVLITVGLTLTVVEGCLLISVRMKPRAYFDPRAVNYPREEAEGVGYRLVPGIHTPRKLHTSGEVIYDVAYTIGEDGYRQITSNEAFDAHLFGGSFVFGSGLNDDETLSAYLQYEHDINTKNLGVPAYGLHQALYNITDGMSAYEGVNIILTSPFHALRSSCKPKIAIGTPKFGNQGNMAVLQGVCPRLSLLQRALQYSQIYHLIYRAFGNAKNVISDEDIELYFAIIRSIYKETLDNNSRLLIAYIDAKASDLTHTSWTNETLIDKL